MRRSSLAIHRLTTVSLCVAFITVCSWIHIPFFIPFTLQLFAVFLISSLFSPQISFTSLVVYIFAGLLGVPVFSGFRAGISTFASPSGGFLIGFLLASLIIPLAIKRIPQRPLPELSVMVAALLVCYCSGLLWYAFVFAPPSSAPVSDAFAACVFPFFIPDVLKIILAYTVKIKLRPTLISERRSVWAKGDII